MYSFFRKNQKFVMVVMVVLMIAFIIPTFFSRSQNSHDQIYGHIGKETINASQVQRAEQEWNFLTQSVEFQRMTDTGRPQWVPIVCMLASPMPGEPYEYACRRLLSQMHESPELYYLLQLEAQKMGLSPSIEDSNAVLSNPNVAIVRPDGSRVPLQNTGDDDLNDKVRYCMANLMLVNRALVRATEAVKISAPLASYETALQMQQIKVNVADFSSKDYEKDVPAPTDEQLQKHLDRYIDVEPDGPTSETNPFGFGYKYPDRIKLQYIAVPREQVAKAIRAMRDEYDWQVEAHKYYDKHLAEFPATQPTPTSSPADALSLGSVPASRPAATGPTTKPFDQVQQVVINRLVDAQVERLLPQIVSEIRTKLAVDYEAYRNSNPSPTTAPATAVATTGRAAPYNSFEYLQNIAHDIETRHHVTLTVAAINDYKTRRDLPLVTGIGRTAVPGDRMIPFADYAMLSAEAFVPPDQQKQANVLALFQPSKPLNDSISDDTYIFRITEAQPAHKPASLAEVREAVAWDWKRAQSLELAKAEAQKFMESAKTQGVAAAGASAGRRVVMTSFFSKLPNVPIEGYPLPTRAQQIFVEKTYALMGALAKPDGTKPVALIEMAPDAKVSVAELIAVESALKEGLSEMAQVYYSDQMTQQYRRLLATDWFNINSVMSRLGYQDETGKHTANQPQRASAQ